MRAGVVERQEGHEGAVVVGANEAVVRVADLVRSELERDGPVQHELMLKPDHWNG